MDISQVIRRPDPRKSVQVELREVVRDVGNKPHVFIRARLSGWHFPERAPEPFVVIGKAVSRFVVIGPGGDTADAYFNVRPAAAREVSFGYGKAISWDFEAHVDAQALPRLDRARLPKGVIDLRPARN